MVQSYRIMHLIFFCKTAGSPWYYTEKAGVTPVCSNDQCRLLTTARCHAGQGIEHFMGWATPLFWLYMILKSLSMNSTPLFMFISAMAEQWQWAHIHICVNTCCILVLLEETIGIQWGGGTCMNNKWRSLQNGLPNWFKTAYNGTEYNLKDGLCIRNKP